jgi:large subunit ribosomal protein L10
MNRQQKAQVVDELAEVMARSGAGVFTNYQGLTTAELTVLRGKLREAGIEYKVVKNTLARLAARKTGKDFLSSSFEGPVAIAFGFGNEVEPARAVLDYIRSSGSALVIKGGFLAHRLLTQDEVKTLATIPPREVLLAQMLGGLNTPVVALLSCLAGPIRQLTGILQARMKQLEA